MSQTVLYKLRPRSPLHLGERGIGLEETAEIIHSDTLFSAIVSAWAYSCSRDDVDKQIGACVTVGPGATPALQLSSAFPYVGDVLFFPRPLITLGSAELRKDMKKVRFVSEGRLKGLADGDTSVDGPFRVEGQWVNGDSAEAQTARAGGQRLDVDLVQGALWCTSEEMYKLAEILLRGAPKRWDRLTKSYRLQRTHMRVWQADEDALLARVAVDRVSSTSELFHCGRLYFSDECGLYFWARFADTAYRRYLEQALDILQDEGLGGRRSTGHGQFSWSAEERPLPVQGEDKSYLLLSLYHPTRQEASELIHARYRLIRRRGWVFSPESRSLRRQGVNMLQEGSLLPRAVQGDVLNVAPRWDTQGKPIELSHPVLRYGLAFTLPLGLEVRR